MEKGKKEANKKTKKEIVNKEEVSEIFEVEKDGKEKEIVAHGMEEIKEGPAKAGEKAPSMSQKKTFMIIILVMLGLVILFLSFYWFTNYTKTFEYQGVKFYIDKEDIAGLTLYKTSLPVIYNGSANTYNFFLRTDPRTLGDVAFDGNLTITHNMVINSTNNLNCNGMGNIAMVNLVNLYTLIGTTVIKDDNATCSPVGQYTFLRIEEGNETKIEQFGPSCYRIEISNCDVLKGTEKFMVETLSKVDSVIKS